MNIVNIGHVCIDHNISEHAEYTSSGGASTFMAKIFSKIADIDYTVVSHYGKDFEPYKKDLKIYPNAPIHEKTLVYQNIHKFGNREQKALNRDNSGEVTLDDNLKSLLSKADVVIISPLLPNYSREYLKSIIDCVRPDTIKLLLPQGYFRDFDRDDNVLVRDFLEFKEIIPLANFIVVSEKDSEQPYTDTYRWLNLCDISTIVTMSERGAEYKSRSSAYEVPTDPVPEDKIIDSVGSGDIFSASFIYQFAKSGNIVQSIGFANMVARECLYYTSEQLNSADLESLTFH